jgi:hypothetical protein
MVTWKKLPESNVEALGIVSWVHHSSFQRVVYFWMPPFFQCFDRDSGQWDPGGLVEVGAAGVVVNGKEEYASVAADAVDREIVGLKHGIPAGEIQDSCGDRSPLVWIVQDILVGDRKETRGPFHRIHPFLDCRLPVRLVSISFAGGEIVVVAKNADAVAVVVAGAEGNFVVEGEDWTQDLRMAFAAAAAAAPPPPFAAVASAVGAFVARDREDFVDLIVLHSALGAVAFDSRVVHNVPSPCCPYYQSWENDLVREDSMRTMWVLPVQRKNTFVWRCIGEKGQRFLFQRSCFRIHGNFICETTNRTQGFSYLPSLSSES